MTQDKVAPPVLQAPFAWLCRTIPDLGSEHSCNETRVSQSRHLTFDRIRLEREPRSHSPNCHVAPVPDLSQ